MHRCPVCDGDTVVEGRECLICRDDKLNEYNRRSAGYQKAIELDGVVARKYADYIGTAHDLQKMRAERRGQVLRLRGARKAAR